MRASLLDAVGDDDEARVARELASGADPNVIDPEVGTSPLSRACFRNHLGIVEQLLRAGADPNLRLTYRSPVDDRIERGVVALMFARSAEVVAALLAAGADPNVTDQTGETPLMRAALGGPPSAVDTLLAAGADPAHRNAEGRTARELVRDRLAWHRRDGAPWSPKLRKRVADLEQIEAALGGGAGG